MPARPRILVSSSVFQATHTSTIERKMPVYAPERANPLSLVYLAAEDYREVTPV